MKFKSLLVAILVLSISLSACGSKAAEEVPTATNIVEPQEAEALSENVTELVEAVEAIAEQSENTMSTPEGKNLDSLSLFIDKIDAMVDYFDEATEDEDDMSYLGDGMLMGMIGMKLNNIELDRALMMAGEEWEKLDDAMPNGNGTSDSVMVKDGDVYTYTYANKWNNGSEDTVAMVFDAAAMTIDHSSASTNPENIKGTQSQFYLDANGGLYISQSEYVANNAANTQYVFYYDGTVLNYGSQVVADADATALAVDLLADQPDGWATMVSGKTFDKTFTFDGTNISYVHP